MTFIPFLFLLPFACDDEPKEEEENTSTENTSTDGESNNNNQDDYTLCGQLEIPQEYCGDMPENLEIWTTKEGETSCDMSAMYDTGGTGELWEWKEEMVMTVDVDDDGRFYATLDPGEYSAVVDGDTCYGCESFDVTGDGCTNVTLVLEEYMFVDAPNIYLYPKEPTATHVQVGQARNITISDPVYPHGGWWTLALPNGQLLTEAGWKDFLFYEMKYEAKRFQYEEGWCVRGEHAQASIEKAMEIYGFLPNEIADFADFWDSEFPEAPEMTIYPQSSGLVSLRISPKPENFLRVWFLVEDGCQNPIAPQLFSVDRSAYHGAEWGVAITGNLPGPEAMVLGWQ